MSARPLPDPQRFVAISRFRRVRCENCGRMTYENVLRNHQRFCGAGELAPKMPEGHRKCSVPGCSCYVNMHADRCYRHSERGERMDELDALIATGRGDRKPREDRW